jgi:hypothetical protein
MALSFAGRAKMSDDKDREREELRARLATYQGSGFGKAPSDDNDQSSRAEVEMTFGCLSGIVLLAGAAWLLTQCVERTNEPARTACNDEVGAYVMSQTFVKRQLKAPSTADFPTMGIDDVSVSSSGHCEFTVVAYVDAQNSFGAKLRTPYVAVVKAPETGDEWTLKSLSLDD